MTYLVKSSHQTQTLEVREKSSDLWRQIRRYNLPVQLALLAACDAAKDAENSATAALFSLAPCQTGSPELFHWVEATAAPGPTGHLGNLRINPAHTLHAVDNLALSAFAIMHGNHAYCLGLGGAAGQAWCGLEALHERLSEEQDAEALLLAGDQANGESKSGDGVAMLFSRHPKPYRHLGRLVRLVSVERRRLGETCRVQPHASAGLASLRNAIHEQGKGHLCYQVPMHQSNGTDQLIITFAIS